MKTLRTLVLLFVITTTQAQHEADNWYFGANAGITFSTNPATPVSGSQINTYEGCTSISDAAGNLLFYSDGVFVWNSNHVQMPNGFGLGGGASSTQSCIAVLQPGSGSTYYLFTTPQANDTLPLCYSIVDMTLNGGLGDIVSKNTLVHDSCSEKLTAVYHANGTDVWVISHKTNSAQYLAWLVTATGVSTTPVVSLTGIAFTGSSSYGLGYLRTSPCGNKIASCLKFNSTCELFDFDNSTGIISNPVLVYSFPTPNYNPPYGVEFSPDNSKLYTAIYNPPTIIQYNLLAGSSAAIIASATTIGTSPNIYGGALQTGPDGRIYFSKYLDSTLACITNPNVTGVACNYIENYMPHGGFAGRPGLPNFVTSYFCNLSVNTHNPNVANSTISLYPNPASTSLTISLGTNTTSSTAITIINTLGAKVYSATIPASASDNTITIPLTNLSKGIYFLKAQSEDGVEAKRFVVE